MIALKVFSGLITLFMYLPVSVYAGWLMYNHVHATDLMWFLFWLQYPLLIVSQIINAITNAVANKK